jgi:hypothetical protein
MGFKMEKTDLERVQRSGVPLCFIPERRRTPEVCLAAVQNNGYALSYVPKQTPEICLAAVRRNGGALQYVVTQTPEICMAAVQATGEALYYVKTQTPEICMAAVRQSGQALEFVKDKTLKLCLVACRSNPWIVVQYVPDEFIEECTKYGKRWRMLDDLANEGKE